MLAVVDAKALILCADEDGGDDVASDEDAEHGIVDVGILDGVKDGEEDESEGADDGEDDCANGQALLNARSIVRQTALVSEVALKNESNVEDDDSDCGAGDEQRLQAGGANVGDVCDVLIRSHTIMILRFAIRYPHQQHGKKSS